MFRDAVDGHAGVKRSGRGDWSYSLGVGDGLKRGSLAERSLVLVFKGLRCAGLFGRDLISFG